ncbi:hypothetical protein B5M09_007355 [Aphanomyces astaci]|uniref:Histidine acid phosphatase n=1 Tax=Aphanomyces astaci TaxID=112090 RepID=A0A3R8DIZ7_APHAT|nr:hypothetical protein B5M09_007355 [Aphanomyces astaci]
MARTLRLVQVLHRHGDRSPLHNVFRGGTSTQFQAEDALWTTKLQEPVTTRGIYGELTTVGVAQMQARGLKLRDRYLALGWTLDDKVDIHVRSTHYVRTQRSVQALLSRFVPHVHDQLPLEILPPSVDYINGAHSLPRLHTHLLILRMKPHAALAAREAHMAPVQTELRRLLPMFASSAESFSWMKAADYFVCRQAHNIPLLPHTEMQRVMPSRDVPNATDLSVERVVVYSGHDVSLLALLNALHSSTQPTTKTVVDWPDYGAAVTIELYDEQGNSDQWMVQVTLDGSPVAPPVDAQRFCHDLLQTVLLPNDLDENDVVVPK